MSTQEHTSTNTNLEKETSSSGAIYNITLTPEQVKRIEENRLKAQAKLREKQKQELQNNSTIAEQRDTQGITTNNVNSTEEKKLRPMRKFQNYVEYDFSKMKDTRGGFLLEEQNEKNTNKRKYETEFEALEPCKNYS